MAATTPGNIRKLHEKVVSDRKLNIDFCFGLERKDAKYIAALIEDINRISDIFDRIYVDLPIQDSPSQHWPPDLDYETFRERFFADFSPALGDADIHYWLDRATGTGKSLHSQILDVFRSLFVATHDPDSFHLIFSEDDPDEFVNAVSETAHETLAEIGREHREQLEKINPEMLEAEAAAACRLWEETQHGDNTGGSRKRPAGTGTQTVKPATCNQLMMEIIQTNPIECVGWSAYAWSVRLKKSESTVKGTKAWGVIQGMRAYEMLSRAKPKDRRRRHKKQS